jgi:hypothetical protein
VILPVDVGFGNDKDVVKEKFTKVFEVMALPIINAVVEALDSLLVLCSFQGSVELVCNSFRSLGSGFQLCVVLVVGVLRRLLDQRLSIDNHVSGLVTHVIEL